MKNFFKKENVNSIFVTGADGFIGSNLVDYLISKNVFVKCLIFYYDDQIRWINKSDGSIEIIKGDILDQDSLNEGVKGVDMVFHLAGMVKSRSKKNFSQINVTGTENLIKAIIKNNPNIKRFLYLSSQSASGPSNSEKPITEGDEPAPISDYGRSKLEAERVVLSYQDKIPITIIRPSAVYGPRDKEMFRIFNIVNKGIKPCILCKERYLNFCYIDDLVKAIVLAVTNKKSIGQTYFIHSDQKVSINQFFREIVNSYNKRVATLPVPLFFIKLYFCMNELYSLISGNQEVFTRDKYRELKQYYWLCSIEKAKLEIGYRPDYILQKSLSKSIQWYKKKGWL